MVIRLSDGAPVLFRGDRIGLGGGVFQAYKFRTLAHHTQPGANGLAEAVPFNAFAAFLRATHLDELPQCLNVLRGEMALIGPRPLPVARYRYLVQRDPAWQCVTRVRPGCSSLNQIAFYAPGGLEKMRTLPGLAHLTSRRRLELDQYYINHLSSSLDTRIALWTVSYLTRKMADILLTRRSSGTCAVENAARDE